MMLDSNVIYEQIKNLSKFRSAKICKHYVMLELLSMLESHGESLDQNLLNAISNCDDAEIEKILTP